jgi:hypothetical protein
MDGVQALTAAVKASHDWYNGTVADVTGAQANWLPAGNAHPIGETMAHIVHSEDGIVNGMLRGQALIWQRDGWDKKLGIPNMMMHDNKGARAFKIDPKSLAAYTQAVQSSTLAWLSSLKPADLERVVDGGGDIGKMPVAGVLTMLLVGNNFAHTGEISALKGVQGARGYPF